MFSLNKDINKIKYIFPTLNVHIDKDRKNIFLFNN